MKTSIGVLIHTPIATILEGAFVAKWGWKSQLIHSFLAILALRLRWELARIPNCEKYDQTTSIIHSTFIFLAGSCPEARELARRLSSDSFSFVSRERARRYIDPYFESTVSAVSKGEGKAGEEESSEGLRQASKELEETSKAG